MKRQEGDASEQYQGQEKPPLPLSELVDVLVELKTGMFFFFFFFFFFFTPLSTSITPIFSPLLLPLPPAPGSFSGAVGQSVVGRLEQSAAVWSSSCCPPDQRGQQAWSSWLNVPLEVFDGQSAAGVHAARHVGVRLLDGGPVGYVASLTERKRDEAELAGVNMGRGRFNIIYKVPVYVGFF